MVGTGRVETGAMKQLGVRHQTLPAQLALTFTAVVLLTAAASWLPEVWLLRQQRQEQAWLRVEQGRRTGAALHRKSESDIQSAVSLAAQHSRLQEAAGRNESEELRTYLTALKTSLALDLLLLCDASGSVLVQIGAGPIENICSAKIDGGYQVLAGAGAPEAWLFAVDSAANGTATLGKIIAGKALNDAYASELSRQTGLEHTFLANGQVVASSFRREDPLQQNGFGEPRTTATGDGESGSYAFSVVGTPYFARRLALAAPQLEDEIALNVVDVFETEQQVIRTGTLSFFLVTAAGLVFALFMARNIGKPLSDLADAATRFSQGNLDAQVSVPTQVGEVRLVAQALEEARQSLQSTLAELQNEKAWASHLLESVVEGIVTLDQHGAITFWSKGAEQITGWSRDVVLGRDCSDVLHPVGGEEFFTELIPPPNQRRKVSIALAGGREATLSLTRAELAPTEVSDASLVVVFRDVSEEETVQRLLGHFLANMTHEFRTPLAAVAAAIELLLDQLNSLSQAELEELLRSLHLGIVSLQTLVDNLLESASLEAGKFNVSPRRADLCELVSEARRTM